MARGSSSDAFPSPFPRKRPPVRHGRNAGGPGQLALVGRGGVRNRSARPSEHAQTAASPGLAVSSACGRTLTPRTLPSPARPARRPHRSVTTAATATPISCRRRTMRPSTRRFSASGTPATATATVGAEQASRGADGVSTPDGGAPFEGVFLPPAPTRRTTLDVGSPDVGRVLAEGYGVAEAKLPGPPWRAPRPRPPTSGTARSAIRPGPRATRGRPGRPRGPPRRGGGDAGEPAKVPPGASGAGGRGGRRGGDGRGPARRRRSSASATRFFGRRRGRFRRRRERRSGRSGAAARGLGVRGRAEALRDRGRIGDRAGETDSLCRCTMC